VRNSQAWVFSVQGNQVHLLADVRNTQPVADPVTVNPMSQTMRHRSPRGQDQTRYLDALS
jgi:hypothetical protein